MIENITGPRSQKQVVLAKRHHMTTEEQMYKKHLNGCTKFKGNREYTLFDY